MLIDQTCLLKFTASRQTHRLYPKLALSLMFWKQGSPLRHETQHAQAMHHDDFIPSHSMVRTQSWAAQLQVVAHASTTELVAQQAALVSPALPAQDVLSASRTKFAMWHLSSVERYTMQHLQNGIVVTMVRWLIIEAGRCARSWMIRSMLQRA